MDKINILFISIAFPPKNDPESLQAAKYFKYLSLLNCKIDIVTSAIPTLHMPEDKNLKTYLINYRQFIEIVIKENKYFNYSVRKLFPNYLEKPDSKFGFFKQWEKITSTLKIIPDIIYSRSFPLSSTFMAEKLKAHYKVPWVLHLSDLWADSPIHNYSGKLKQFHEEKESECFNKADFICITSEEALEFYQKKYPAICNKFQFFPNVYDPDDIIETEYTINDKLKFIYTGGLAGGRSPKYLLEAIKYIFNENPNELNNVEFIFAGQFDRQNEKIFKKYNLPMVMNVGLLPYSKALKLQKQADVLLIIDAPFDSNINAMFFPSKILDYIIANKRMLAITNKESTTYKIVQGKYGDCFSHNDINGIIRQIKNIILQHKERNKNYFYQTQIDGFYSANANASRLEKLLASLVKEKN